jgi:hypothetical protein
MRSSTEVSVDELFVESLSEFNLSCHLFVRGGDTLHGCRRDVYMYTYAKAEFAHRACGSFGLEVWVFWQVSGGVGDLC